MYSVNEEEGSPLALLDTYLAMVSGSVGSCQYRSLYVNKNGDNFDVINDGDLACAFYVSSILHTMNLIKNGVHTTVQFVESDMTDSGWQKVEEPRAGAVVVWENKNGDDGATHKHIGICLDEKFCVSTSPKERSPIKHEIYGLVHHNGQKRNVDSSYFHPTLTK